MALKVELKPGEKLLVGQCIITNSGHRARILIEGTAPVLREKDILTADTAETPAKRIYLAVQLMYIADDIGTLQNHYFSLINEFVAAVPSTLAIADRINNHILTHELYKALKTAKELIQYERSLIDHVSSRRGGFPDENGRD